MTRFRIFAAIVTTHMTVAIGFTSPAPAQGAADPLKASAIDCTQANDHERRIRGCTAAIASGRLTGKDLAIAHFLRARAHHERHELALAFADFSYARKLLPDFDQAHAGQLLVVNSSIGLCIWIPGAADVERRIDACSVQLAFAAEIKSVDVFALAERGFLLASSGMPKAAIADLTRARDLNARKSPTENRFSAEVAKRIEDTLRQLEVM